MIAYLNIVYKGTSIDFSIIAKFNFFFFLKKIWSCVGQYNNQSPQQKKIGIWGMAIWYRECVKTLRELILLTITMS